MNDCFHPIQDQRNMAEFHRLPSLNDIQKRSKEWQEYNQTAELRARESTNAPVPSLEHVTFQDFDQVYEPSADTYLLLDALLYDLPSFLDETREKQKLVVWEIGCGSGVVTSFIRSHLKKEHVALSIASDVNLAALEMTKMTVKENDSIHETQEIPLELLRCNLGANLIGRLDEKIDIVVFNPPYVPTEEEEVTSTGIAAAWAGGLDGRTVVDRAIPQISRLLAKTGSCYLVTVDDNRCEDLAQYASSFGLQMKPLFRKRTRNEFLTIQKLVHVPSQR